MTKRLYRSRKNRMLGGVAGGLADYFDIDPVIVRVLFVITVLGWGTGVLVYVILWVVVPEIPFKFQEYSKDRNNDFEKDHDKENIDSDYIEYDSDYYTEPKKSSNNGKVIIGVILVFFGIVFLLDEILPDIDYDYLWPIGLIILGGYILYKSIGKNNKEKDYENF